MPTAALVNSDGLVENVVVLEADYLDDDNPATSYTPPAGLELVLVPDDLLEHPDLDDDEDAPPRFSVGWRWDGSTFTPPEPVDDPTVDDRARLNELRAQAVDGDKLTRAELDEALTLALRLGVL